MESPIVTVRQGKLAGKITNDIKGKPFYSFLGVPYAKAPTGELRFKAPQPAENWDGVRDATKYGSVFCQKNIILIEAENTDTSPIIGTEDGLFLNIFTHAIKNDANLNLKPVMLYIHGGAFIGGSSDMSGPEILMTDDIVFVTINYRVGALGFLVIDDPSLEVPGNAGLKDMVQALKWTNENIAQFGGDPNNVTILGCSAGGAAVHYLMLSPLAQGLFHKAIVQSGCALNAWAQGENSPRQLAQILGCTETDNQEILRFLQQQPATKILEAQLEIGDHLDGVNIRPFGPSIEKDSKDAFIAEQPLELIRKGRFNKVPIMIGYTSMEGIMIEILRHLAPLNTTVFVPLTMALEKNTPIYEETNREIIEYFFQGTEIETNKEALYNVFTDNAISREVIAAAKEHAKTSPHPVYLYRVSIETNLNVLKKLLKVETPGVCHGEEMSYLVSMPMVKMPEIEAGSVEEIGLERFVKMWTNFARSGNPIPVQDSLLDAEWKPVEGDKVNYLDIGLELVPGVDPDAERMAFWQKLYERSAAV